MLKSLGDNVNRQSVASAFGKVEYKGVTKLVKFQPNGEVEGANDFIYQVKGGKIIVLGNTVDLIKS
ncbi:hypothetical protein FDG2_2098 [Candidatus Protofrankia californiensis]|uniref:Leucine-binding protein domain-containing protein n=1 Tax=Candidatus Protofrankia californiensis TaxID=1839754 RepID=A0A1C3NWY7_9ACTN|nr:hypothetical protein FDG2_2098 [Candidatus Protofrankia californiensis]